MNRRCCQNHPDREGTCRCHACGGYFCVDCVVEGPEYYYCKAEACQDACTTALTDSEHAESLRGQPSCTVGDEEREWIERSLLWFIDEFGRDVVPSVPVVIPTADFFPEEYDGSEEAVESLLHRVSGWMRIDPKRVDFAFFQGEAKIHDLIPVGRSRSEGPAGLFTQSGRTGRLILGLEISNIGNPEVLVAVMAHELSHVHLLADKRLTGEEADHEALADLLTVFFGLGVFTANAAFSFAQWHHGMTYGWSTRRMGYLSEPMWGFALAAFSWMRQDLKPRWSKYLVSGVNDYRKRSMKYFMKGGHSALPTLGSSGDMW